MLRKFFCAALLLALFTASALAGGDNEPGKDKKPPVPDLFDHVKTINPDLPTLNDPPRLDTPHATYENFLESSRAQNFERAARSLDFRYSFKGVRSEDRPRTAAQLAEKLYSVLDRKLWGTPSDLPDTPDGQSVTPQGPTGPVSRILIGKITLNGRVVPVELWRIKADDAEQAVWLFSPSLVEKIEPLYEKYGPRWLERVLGHSPLWEWAALALTVLLASALGWYVQHQLKLYPQGEDDPWHHALLVTLRLPVGCLVGSTLVYLVVTFALTISGPIGRILDPLLLVIVIVSLGWTLLVSLNFATQEAAEHYVKEMQGADAANARSMLTRIAVARRLVFLGAIGATAGLILVQLQLMETVGYALLGAAGVVGLIVGVAAQPVLGNLMAGIQIAVTQPIRIGDAVVFQGEFGHVEEIAFSYLVIRTWDLRRLVVPLSFLISQPIENWTRAGTNLIRPILLHVDYRTDIEALRRKYEELLRASTHWDGKVAPIIQVVGCNQETMEIRALCSAANAPAAWNLQCEMREKLIRYIQDLEGGRYLPQRRMRVETVGNGTPPIHGATSAASS